MTSRSNHSRNLASAAAWRRVVQVVRYFVVKQAILSIRRFPTRGVVVVWPPFDDSSHATGVIEKVQHYVGDVPVRIRWYVRQDSHLLEHDLMNHEVSVLATSRTDVERELRRVRFVAEWRQDRPMAGSLTPQVYRVGESRNHHAQPEWLRLTREVHAEFRPPVRSEATLPTNLPSCAVVGSGPSAQFFAEERSIYGGWICANFVAAGITPAEAENLVAVCVIDGMFYSPTRTMEAYWAAVFAAIENSRAVVVTPRIFAPYVDLHFPSEWRRRFVFLDLLGYDRLLPSGNEPLVVAFGNVLTDLMLPVAARLSRRVVLYGCDGAPPDSGGRMTKAPKFSSYTDRFASEYEFPLGNDFFLRYWSRHEHFTQYVVNRVMRKGVAVSLRAPSWNAGLSHLAIEQPLVGREASADA